MLPPAFDYLSLIISVFTRNIPTLLRRCGDQWTAPVNGVDLAFFGIFDVQTVVNTSDGVAVLERQSYLTLATDMAEQIEAEGFPQTLTDHRGVEWQCRAFELQDDGALSKAVLVRVS